MPSGGGDFQRALQLHLALDIAHAQFAAFEFFILGGLGAGEGFASGKMRANPQQRVGGEDLRGFGQGAHCGVLNGEDERAPVLGGGQRHGQRAAAGAEFAGEGEFARELLLGEEVFGNLPGCGEYAEGDGEVVSPALFWQVGGGQIDSDDAGGKLKVAVQDCGADAVAGFFDFGVGESDNVEPGESAGEMHLHRDRRGANPRQGAAV